MASLHLLSLQPLTDSSLGMAHPWPHTEANPERCGERPLITAHFSAIFLFEVRSEWLTSIAGKNYNFIFIKQCNEI